MRIRTWPGLGVGTGRCVISVSNLFGGVWFYLGWLWVIYLFDLEDIWSAGFVDYGCFHLCCCYFTELWY
jgi:hypothetical protein